jgi:ADP-ribose pyrophosphatase YjhB (NUDIX family)
MNDIPPGTRRGWAVRIDGELVQVQHVEISSPRFGTLEYGLRSEGYDGWAFFEVGGGGAVVLLYFFSPSGRLMVGLVRESRPNMDEQPVWCIAGGFVNPGEMHKLGAKREVMEEAGVSTAKTTDLGKFNPNRAFFVTDGGGGVRAYGMEIPYAWVELDTDGENTYRWRLKPGVVACGIKPEAELRFFTASDAVKSTMDALALAAIARLICAVRPDI